MSLDKTLFFFVKSVTNGIIEKIDIIIRLDKKVRVKLPKVFSSFVLCFFLLITNPFLCKKFLISKIEILIFFLFILNLFFLGSL